MQLVLVVALTTTIVVGLPCLLVRPLLIAIADRISGKRGSAKEIQEMKNRISSLEQELRSLRVHVIGIESSQEFSNKLLESIRTEQQDAGRKEP